MDILLHCTSGLHRHELIEYAAWGSLDHLNEIGKRHHGDKWIEVSGPGMLVSPTQFGIDYYLWANGSGRTNRTQFASPQLTLPELSEISIPEGAAPTQKI